MQKAFPMFPRVTQCQSIATVPRGLMNGSDDGRICHACAVCAGNGLHAPFMLVTASLGSLGRLSLHQAWQLWVRIASEKAPWLLSSS